MKKRFVFTALALAVSLVFSGCGSDNTGIDVEISEIAPIDKNDTSQDIEVNVPETVEDSDLPPEEGMVRSRLTNEWVSEDLNNTRPVAIMIPNSNTAYHYGLSDADILYECNVEGSMTRLMAIFQNWKAHDKLGNIRSCRDYYVYWAFEWDAIYIHYGGPFYIEEVIGRDDTQNINCINLDSATFRDTAKNSTDNAFTSADRIEKAMEHYGYSTEYRADYADEEHFKFAPFNNPNTLDQYPKAMVANRIDMSKTYPVTNCYLIYNSETGLYERFQKVSGASDGPHIDMENNQQLAFKNVIVQNTYHEVRDQKGYLAFQVHDTTRDGWYFTNGKGIHVNWKKETDYGATRYYDDDGNEISLNTGKTMIFIVESGDSFDVDDQTLTSEK